MQGGDDVGGGTAPSWSRVGLAFLTLASAHGCTMYYIVYHNM